ncbi:MAG: methyltransferase domain-containing protein [Verrucomicrobiota bacterium]
MKQAHPVYDSIGKTYRATRAADPRITESLVDLLDLDRSSSILDIGAGTGNYSEALAKLGFSVVALEPSEVMRAQGKQHPKLEWRSGQSENLPFDRDSFDGVIMTLCMHHFNDWQKALREAVRVVGDGPIVILTFDAWLDCDFWLFDYFPAFLEQDKKWFPKISEIESFLKTSLGKELSATPFALPKDLIDHFAAASWARPELYLGERYRAGISSFFKVEASEVSKGLSRLSIDLSNGTWDKLYGFHRERDKLDVGYRFLTIG